MVTFGPGKAYGQESTDRGYYSFPGFVLCF